MLLNSKSLGHKIAETRKKLNLSQAELAQKVSISPQAVGKWERGESMPNLTTLHRLADIFNVDLNYFTDNYLSEKEPSIQLSKNNSEQENSNRFDWNWNMSEGNWSDADFSGIKNLNEKFSSSNVKNCSFKNADLSGLEISKNNIELCDFSNSNIRNSQIRVSNLLKNNYFQCSFIDTKFYKNNIEKCDFTASDFSGAELLELNIEYCELKEITWSYTIFKRSNLSNVVFSGEMKDCHFEQCSFYNVKFENAIIQNTFFKYNDRFKKVQFIDCKVDTLTYAFLKNNGANLEGIQIIE